MVVTWDRLIDWVRLNIYESLLVLYKIVQEVNHGIYISTDLGMYVDDTFHLNDYTTF